MPQLPDSGFDRVSSFYDPLSRLVFGSALELAQLALLPFVPAKARMLLIGGGSGWLLEQLLRSGKELQILYLEASPNMLRKAQERTKASIKNTAVEFRLGTEDVLKAHEQFDVVLTPFLLDLFPAPRLHDLMHRLHTALIPGGLWLFADFWPVTSPAPLWQHLLLKSMYVFFGVLSDVKATQLPDFKAQFDRLYLQEVYAASFYGGMVQAKVYRKAIEV
ncbi:class I SAM-dependent methyltransferase [Pontibacter ruber]|uniref:Class I SAM-dependent methyltransferase n=1 Tax=Pontibacter ruber TaxID=1343895 RepID=A0ABW5CTS4_9BACT|nr:class I SAM-dependent methyltransferase [Pontibacter ruber]